MPAKQKKNKAPAQQTTELETKIIEPPIEDELKDEVGNPEYLNFESFIENYTSQEGKELLLWADEEFSALSFDSSLKELYEKRFKIVGAISTGIYNFKVKYRIDDDLASMYFEEVFKDNLQFVTISFEDTFDGLSPYVSNSTLLEKSKTTQGKQDEIFFEARMSLYGDFASTYSFSLHYFDGGGYSHSILGNGTYLQYISVLNKASLQSLLFRVEIIEMTENLTNISGETFFGSRKESVLEEIETILQLKESTNINLSNIEKLKAILDTATSTVYYNCDDSDCFKHFN